MPIDFGWRSPAQRFPIDPAGGSVRGSPGAGTSGGLLTPWNPSGTQGQGRPPPAGNAAPALNYLNHIGNQELPESIFPQLRNALAANPQFGNQLAATPWWQKYQTWNAANPPPSGDLSITLGGPYG